jgi:VCBS repeat-containing protein
MLPGGGTITTAKGLLTLNADGTYTYVPTIIARHAAAKNGADISTATDSIPIVVTNSQGVSATTSLSVPISKQNNAPSVTNVQVGPWLGGYFGSTRNGYISVSDADNDALRYLVDGRVVDQNNGYYDGRGFVYMWASGAGFAYQYNVPTSTSNTYQYSFDVNFQASFSDGYGGIAYASVTMTFYSTR